MFDFAACCYGCSGSVGPGCCSVLFVEYKNGAFLFGGWRGAVLLWSLLPRLLSAGWGGVGGRWMRRAADMSEQRFIP